MKKYILRTRLLNFTKPAYLEYTTTGEDGKTHPIIITDSNQALKLDTKIESEEIKELLEKSGYTNYKVGYLRINYVFIQPQTK